jgi:uncharacterized protein
VIAAVLAWSHFCHLDPLTIQPVPRALIGVLAGIGIGVVAVLMGVAGGELLIPTIVLLFAVDIKIAGSLSLAISYPPCWSRSPATAASTASKPSNQQDVRPRDDRGVIVGTIIGGLLLGVVRGAVLIPLFVAPHRLIHQSQATRLNHRPPEPALVTIAEQRSLCDAEGATDQR